jgi:hypothetical protein
MHPRRKEEKAAPGGGLGRRIGLALAASALGLTAVEWACRWRIPAPVAVQVTPQTPLTAAPAEVRLSAHPEQGGLYVETPTGRRLRPRTVARIDRHALSGIPVEIRTNSLGYRDREPGPPRGRRLLFLGDSITFADYLPEEQTFVRQVETLARAAGLDWETLNAGVGAVSLKTELAILLETGLALRPDTVVLNWYLNDFQDSPGVEVRALPALARHSRLAYALSLIGGTARGTASGDLPLAAWQSAWRRDQRPFLVDRDTAREAFFREVDRFFFDWGGAWCDPAWAVMNPLLDEFQRLSRAHDFHLRLVAHPTRAQVEAPFDAGQPQARLAEWAQARRVPLLDLLPVLRARHTAGSPPLFYDQCHHTPEASARVAEAITAWLRADAH